MHRQSKEIKVVYYVPFIRDYLLIFIVEYISHLYCEYLSCLVNKASGQ